MHTYTYTHIYIYIYTYTQDFVGSLRFASKSWTLPFVTCTCVGACAKMYVYLWLLEK